MTTAPPTDFASLPIRDELLQALTSLNYQHMTPIQQSAITPMLEGRDVLAQAETGSGKTAAFAISLLNKLNLSEFDTQALIICPTRELSEQVATEIRRLASALPNTRVVTLCGGKPMHDQLVSLKRSPHVVVGTPGRLKKHLEKGTLTVSTVQSLVLDEADRMLDMGFHDDILQLLAHLPRDSQTLLFSATYPNEIVAISRHIQQTPVEIRLEPKADGAQIEQVFVFANDQQKPESLFRTLGRYQPENAIIFCNRKQQAQELCDSLRAQGYSARALHGDLDQRDRDEAIILFGNKSVSYLVATDVAARGLDIAALAAVINYDLSTDPETHLHRIGRTGRAGLNGMAISLVHPDEMHRVRAIESLLGTPVQFTELHRHHDASNAIIKPATRTLQLNVGKKDKIRPGDIVGALTASGELSNDDIGKITVQAKVSFVAVNHSKADTALHLLSEGRIKKVRVRARLLR